MKKVINTLILLSLLWVKNASAISNDSTSKSNYISLGYGSKPINCYEEWNFSESPLMKRQSKNLSLLYNRRLYNGKKFFINSAIGLNANFYSLWYIQSSNISELDRPFIQYSTFNIGLQTSASLGFKLLDRPKFRLDGLMGINTSGTFISNTGSSQYSTLTNNRTDTLDVIFYNQQNNNFYLSVFLDVMATFKPYRLSIGVKRFSPHAPDRLNINYEVQENGRLLYKGKILDGYSMYQLYLCYHLR